MPLFAFIADEFFGGTNFDHFGQNERHSSNSNIDRSTVRVEGLFCSHARWPPVPGQNTDKPPLDGWIVGKTSLFLTPLCFPGTRAIHPDTESRYTEIENVSAPDLLLKVEAEAEEASQNFSEC